MQLDAIDREIIEVLRHDGRIANVDLAARVGLSPSPCLRRVRRLEDVGVITGYRADIAPGTDGRGFLVIASVRLGHHGVGTVEDFEDAAAAHPDITECLHVAGSYDYLLRIEVADLAAYDAFSRTAPLLLTGMAEMVSHVVLTRSPRQDARR